MCDTTLLLIGTKMGRIAFTHNLCPRMLISKMCDCALYFWSPWRDIIVSEYKFGNSKRYYTIDVCVHCEACLPYTVYVH